MNRLVYLLLLVLCVSPLYAQDGHYYLSHYTSDQQTGSLCFDIAQDANGLMYFATRTGLKQFDGRHWRNITSNSSIYTLSLSEDGQLFAGGEDGVGVITKAADFSLNVIPLYEEDGLDLFESVPVNEGTLFISEKSLIVLNHKTKKTEKIKVPDGKEGFANGFDLHKTAYVSTFDGTTYKVEGNTLKPAAAFTPKAPVLFTASLNQAYFIVTEDQKLFISSRPSESRLLPLPDSAYLGTGIIVNGCWVTPELIALGTLNGGVLFINTATGRTEEIINYYSGLPDNEVFCLKRDAEGRVWVAHEYGYSAISPNLPFRSFNHYDGLQGNIVCALTTNGKVYVGTSVGLFVLDKLDKFTEEVYYVDKKIAVKSKPTQQKGQAPPTAPPVEEKRKGLFRFLKKKEKSSSVPVVVAPKQDLKAETIVSRIRQTRKILLGSTYMFQKISGIDSKVMFLLQQNDKLYAAGLSGFFEIKDKSSVPVAPEPIVSAASTKKNGIVLINYRNEVSSWNGTERKLLIEDVHDEITSISEDESGGLWMTGAKTIYLYSSTNNLQSFAFTNPALDRTVGTVLPGGPVFVNSFGFYTYNSGAVRVIDSLGKPSQFFASSSNLWFKINDEWQSIGSFNTTKNIKYLSIFSELRYIEPDEQSNALWVITKDNKLYRFYINQTVPGAYAYPLMLRSVHNKKHFFDPAKSSFVVAQNEGQLTIEVMRPTFESQQGVQYRFAFDNSQWSDWSGEGQFSFPYLPLGEYKLKLQSRDIMGEITELKPIQVKIEPPFWKTTWFYALEFLVFAILVIISIRLQVMYHRYRIVAQLFSILTIVLLITFIQSAFYTYLATTSPVIDFAIQVGVALLVLPVELYLRKVIFNPTSTGKIFKIITTPLKKQPSEPIE